MKKSQYLGNSNNVDNSKRTSHDNKEKTESKQRSVNNRVGMEVRQIKEQCEDA